MWEKSFEGGYQSYGIYCSLIKRSVLFITMINYTIKIFKDLIKCIFFEYKKYTLKGIIYCSVFYLYPIWYCLKYFYIFISEKV